jgi:PPOX class probable F420-dependent enzyme
MPTKTEEITTGETITPEIADWLMEKLRWPVMATIKSDGMPSQSVVWFDLIPDQADVVLLNTLKGRIKEQHLRRDPRMSLCFEEDWDYVTLEGRAELIDDEERGMTEIKYLAGRYGANPEKYNGQHRVPILFHVERVIRHS